MSRQAQLLLIWVLCSFIGAALALQLTRAAYTEGTWLPVSNDSFYHARRILDAAESTRGFYQFDDTIHAPEGSWINWPWAYDWVMAKGLQAVKAVSPGTNSMYFLTHVPVYWVFVNAAVLLGICMVLGLQTHWIALVMAGFAVSPLTQALHGVGLIDHHYIEYSFVLLTLLTGLWWLREPERSLRAAVLGITLGLAPAFHTGLFILQLPLLLTLFLLWLRGQYPPRGAVLGLACALILTTLAVLLPSEPFRQGQFQFAVLSWFHLYIAAVSTLVLLAFTKVKRGLPGLLGFALLGIALILPIWNDTLGGAAFLSSNILNLDDIAEVRGPLKMALTSPGPADTLGYYSLFIVVTPLLFLIYLWRVATLNKPQPLFFACMTVFGLALLLTQFRLHYFGNFAILLGWVVLLAERWPALNRYALRTFASGLLVLAVAYQPSFANIHFKKWALGWDPGYEDIYPLFADLEKACAAAPGIVITDNNLGHPARFHSQCSVVANNFLMTKQHEDKVRELQGYLAMSAEELLEAGPKDMRYVLARLGGYVFVTKDNRVEYSDTQYLKQLNDRLYFELNTRKDLPARYRLIASLPIEDARGFTRAALYEVLPDTSDAY